MTTVRQKDKKKLPERADIDGDYTFDHIVQVDPINKRRLNTALLTDRMQQITHLHAEQMPLTLLMFHINVNFPHQ